MEQEKTQLENNNQLTNLEDDSITNSTDTESSKEKLREDNGSANNDTLDIDFLGQARVSELEIENIKYYATEKGAEGINVPVNISEYPILEETSEDPKNDDNGDVLFEGEVEVVQNVKVPSDCIIIAEVGNNGTKETKTKPKTRKRKIDKYEWKKECRKKNYQAGVEHVNSKNTLRMKKEIKISKDCASHCRYKCSTKISMSDRKHIFSDYYKQNQDGKYNFINNTTERILKKRPTKESSRRNYSFQYYFSINGKKIQVCKTFYLTTLDISQKPVYHVHEFKNKRTEVPKNDMRGKMQKGKRKISEEARNEVKKHIESFHVIDSHYCRARTSKQYLESNLTTKKMYDLYKEKCSGENIAHVKESYYRHIFCTEYNIDFHIPKKDRCPTCEKRDVAIKTNLEQEDMGYETHVQEKVEMQKEKGDDKKNSIVPFICFDLQNVITCPRAEVSPLFYYKKLSIYNLTAYFSATKKIYCAIWHEYTGGRSGNDLASAFTKILQKILEENELSEFVTWSDSCVAQNRNSIITLAFLYFLQRHPQIKKLTMKYSVPGHSANQEVDSAHSAIDRAMAKTEFHSPIGLIRILKTIDRQNPYGIIQMQPTDFKDFAKTAKNFNFKVIAYSQVTHLELTHDYIVKFKTSFLEEDYKTVSVKSRQKLNGLLKIEEISHGREELQERKQQKRDHVKNMLAYTELTDREFYRVLFKITDAEMVAVVNKATKPRHGKNQTTVKVGKKEETGTRRKRNTK